MSAGRKVTVTLTQAEAAWALDIIVAALNIPDSPIFGSQQARDALDRAGAKIEHQLAAVRGRKENKA